GLAGDFLYGFYPCACFFLLYRTDYRYLTRGSCNRRWADDFWIYSHRADDRNVWFQPCTGIAICIVCSFPVLVEFLAALWLMDELSESCIGIHRGCSCL